MEIKNIIFDLGNVLLEINTELSKSAFKNKGIYDFDNLYSLAKQIFLFDKLEIGEINEMEFYNNFRKLTGKNLSNKEIEDCWNALIIGFPENNIKIALKAKTKFKTFIISNTNIIHYKYYSKLLKDKFDINRLEDLVHKAYFSHLCKIRKPDSEFFKLVLNENNLNPEETLFIDDDIRNINAAKMLKIQTYHLTDLDLNKALSCLI